MLKIAVIDHHLNNYHADKFLSLVRGPLAGEGADFVTAWESHPVGEDWCANNNVTRAASIAEAVEAADVVMLLSPDDIEAHLELAREVLPFGKPTFIDKLLASSLPAAQEILELSRKHNTPIYSSSSLRYAAELKPLLPELDAAEVSDLYVRGMNSLERYGIHTLTIALRIMGADVKRVIDTGTPLARTVTLDYGSGRRAVVDVRHAENEWDFFAWSFVARAGEKYVGATITDHAAIYENLMSEVLAFFKTGKSSMPIEEAVVAVAIIDAANQSLQTGSEWVTLNA
jgi:hypothetical protein